MVFICFRCSSCAEFPFHIVTLLKLPLQESLIYQLILIIIVHEVKFGGRQKSLTTRPLPQQHFCDIRHQIRFKDALKLALYSWHEHRHPLPVRFVCVAELLY